MLRAILSWISDSEYTLLFLTECVCEAERLLLRFLLIPSWLIADVDNEEGDLFKLSWLFKRGPIEVSEEDDEDTEVDPNEDDDDDCLSVSISGIEWWKIDAAVIE